MAQPWFVVWEVLIVLFFKIVYGEEIFLQWNVEIDTSIRPVNSDQPVITINGEFPGPIINCSTNDVIHVNVANNMDEPLLFTWNGIQQRHNSWQDGVSGTNCPILPTHNWTYTFNTKDQIGSFFYFPSLNFQKAAGGFGSIRVNNHPTVVSTPFPTPEAQIDLLIGDWYSKSYKVVRSNLNDKNVAYRNPPDHILINGKPPYQQGRINNPHESLTVMSGKTYWLRITNVGTFWSLNFRIQNHQMVLVESEGSYTNQITLDSLDVHVGQSYSVLVTADHEMGDYYIVATPKMYRPTNESKLAGVGVLHYENSSKPASGPLPVGPDPFDLRFSMDQAKSIRWNLTAGAARPNPQGSFTISNVTLNQTFLLRASRALVDDAPRYAVNNVSYATPDTPLKLADYYANGSGVFRLDQFSTNSSNAQPVRGVFVASTVHKGLVEFVFENDLKVLDSWHLDGFAFFTVGYGFGKWSLFERDFYNVADPVARSTVQVYPGGWTAVYTYLDNPGMWNLRSQVLKNWYLGEELYVRVHDQNHNPAKERNPPDNLLLCGKYSPPPPPVAAVAPPPPGKSNAPSRHLTWCHISVMCVIANMSIMNRRHQLD